MLRSSSVTRFCQSLFKLHAVTVSLDIRQIPDNQEVFGHPQTDQSIIIEILESVNAPDDITALRDHYNDLRDTNDATNSEVFTAEILPLDSVAIHQCSSALYLHAKQSVSKYKEVARNDVHIHLALFRLPQYTTDVLVTFNDPVMISVDSSSHADVQTRASPWTVDDFKTVISSLTIHDFSIFGS